VSEPSIVSEFDGGFVIDKPSGWHTTSGRGEPAVEAWIRDVRPDQTHIPECGLVHRLDQGTSGCLMAATSLDSSETLQHWMRDGHIHKRYIVMVERRLNHGGTFDLSFTSRYKRSKKVTVSDDGIKKQLGSCAWSVLETTKRRSLIEVKLLGPGRRHQVRAGLASCGFPIVGDTLYGGGEASRLMLHASRLRSNAFSIDIPVTFGLDI
jgi:23S rRNA pseudouridine1911/1915/1917 synthase